MFCIIMSTNAVHIRTNQMQDTQKNKLNLMLYKL